jgi:hypothetical protein
MGGYREGLHEAGKVVEQQQERDGVGVIGFEHEGFVDRAVLGVQLPVANVPVQAIGELGIQLGQFLQGALADAVDDGLESVHAVINILP